VASQVLHQKALKQHLSELPQLPRFFCINSFGLVAAGTAAAAAVAVLHRLQCAGVDLGAVVGSSSLGSIQEGPEAQSSRIALAARVHWHEEFGGQQQQQKGSTGYQDLTAGKKK